MPFTPVASLYSPVEPTASVLPSELSETASPNAAAVNVFDALTYACCDHVVPARVNTYAAPLKPAPAPLWSPLMPVDAALSPGPPTASVLPLPSSATPAPNSPWNVVFDALTYACCDHVMPARVNT